MEVQDSLESKQISTPSDLLNTFLTEHKLRLRLTNPKIQILPSGQLVIDQPMVIVEEVTANG